MPIIKTNYDTTKVNSLETYAAQLDVKPSCRVVATSDITLSGLQTIDSVALNANDRVLLTAQSNLADNGYYLASTGAWIRTSDSNTSLEVTSGSETYIEEGTVYGKSKWVLTTINPIILGTTPLVFSQFSTAPPTWSVIANKPTTVSGFGITDVYTKSEVDTTTNALDTRLDVREAITWQDLLGDISARTTGGTAPTLAAFRGGNCQAWFYAVNNAANIDYHMLHDYFMGSDLFLHLHWGHNGTAISGNLVVQVSMTWSKGHNQDIFSPEIVFNMTIPATDLTVAPRYGHVVSEVQISSATPNAVQFNSNVFEPDGKLLVNAKVITNPTITGGSTNTPYWMGFDVHYQSTSIGTKNKAPNFFV